VAAWSEQTIAKLKQVLTKCLIETQMLDSVKDTTLNPICISAELESGHPRKQRLGRACCVQLF
jgi:hypothetical protein